MVSISDDGIKWNLNKLKNEGLIKRVGPDKGGHWKVKKQ
jgi:ATP-dependent DNA helicase RecG